MPTANSLSNSSDDMIQQLVAKPDNEVFVALMVLVCQDEEDTGCYVNELKDIFNALGAERTKNILNRYVDVERISFLHILMQNDLYAYFTLFFEYGAEDIYNSRRYLAAHLYYNKIIQRYSRYSHGNKVCAILRSDDAEAEMNIIKPNLDPPLRSRQQIQDTSRALVAKANILLSIRTIARIIKQKNPNALFHISNLLEPMNDKERFFVFNCTIWGRHGVFLTPCTANTLLALAAKKSFRPAIESLRKYGAFDIPDRNGLAGALYLREVLKNTAINNPALQELLDDSINTASRYYPSYVLYFLFPTVFSNPITTKRLVKAIDSLSAQLFNTAFELEDCPFYKFFDNLVKNNKVRNDVIDLTGMTYETCECFLSGYSKEPLTKALNTRLPNGFSLLHNVAKNNPAIFALFHGCGAVDSLDGQGRLAAWFYLQSRYETYQRQKKGKFAYFSNSNYQCTTLSQKLILKIENHLKQYEDCRDKEDLPVISATMIKYADFITFALNDYQFPITASPVSSGQEDNDISHRLSCSQ